ncbi:MAG: cellulase family glycosylhydrolase [Oscillospiraceae bacterium]|nr:cellulase family glycosylhydrolase [Oscillospiraceae bacterium]
MKHRITAKAGGLLITAAMLQSQFTAFPANAANLTGKDISECTYTMDLNGQVLEINNPVELTLDSIGVDAAATVTEIWLSFSADTTGKAVQPAFGYYAPGYGEYNWYQEGFYIGSASAVMTAVFEVPSEYPIPDEFQLQLWGAGDDGISSVKINTVGVMTKNGAGAGIGTVTRRGDVNNDRAVNISDVVSLQQFLLSQSEALGNPANADLDGNNRLNCADLTLLKRGLMDGTLGENGNNTEETAMEFVSHIKVGWNLGNTMDSISSANSAPLSNVLQYETYWQPNVTTKAMIDRIKSAGFNTVRVPVSWGQKMDSNYKIDEKWMNRVQEIVDYVIDDGMYCILNIHHDNDIRSQGGYFYPDNSHYTQSEKFVTAVWTQISERFANYDNHLIFETLNEPRLIGHRNEWWIDANNSDCKMAMDCINKLNAASLKAIRNSKGNNATRFVMMPTYAASPDTANLNGCVLPDDPRLIAEIHAYRPDAFALNGTTAQFDPSTDGRGVISFMNNLDSRFIQKGIPVIIDEFGAVNRQNDSERAEWAKFYIETANSHGIPCVWWDNNYDGDFTLLRRSDNTLVHTTVIDAIMNAAAARAE